MKQTLLIPILIALALILSACLGDRAANERAVEKLRQRLVTEDFDKVVDESYEITQSQIGRDDLKARLATATAKLKDIDPEIRWRRSNVLYDEDVSHDGNFSALDLDASGRKITVELDWASNFRLCGMSLIDDVNGPGEKVFRNCD